MLESKNFTIKNSLCFPLKITRKGERDKNVPSEWGEIFERKGARLSACVCAKSLQLCSVVCNPID